MGNQYITHCTDNRIIHRNNMDSRINRMVSNTQPLIAPKRNILGIRKSTNHTDELPMIGNGKQTHLMELTRAVSRGAHLDEINFTGFNHR